MMALYYTELNFNRIFYIYLYSLINLAHTLMLMKASNLDAFYFNIFKTMSNTYFPTKNIKNFITIYYYVIYTCKNLVLRKLAVDQL